MAARASGVFAKPWLPRPLRVCASGALTHSPVLSVVAPGPSLGLRHLRSPSRTDLIIEVTRRSGWFPVRWWQGTVLLKPRTSSGSPLKGSGCRPCPHLPQQSSSSTSTANSKNFASNKFSWMTQDDSIFHPSQSWRVCKMEIWNPPTWFFTVIGFLFSDTEWYKNFAVGWSTTSLYNCCRKACLIAQRLTRQLIEPFVHFSGETLVQCNAIPWTWEAFFPVAHGKWKWSRYWRNLASGAQPHCCLCLCSASQRKGSQNGQACG